MHIWLHFVAENEAEGGEIKGMNQASIVSDPNVVFNLAKSGDSIDFVTTFNNGIFLPATFWHQIQNVELGFVGESRT